MLDFFFYDDRALGNSFLPMGSSRHRYGTSAVVGWLWLHEPGTFVKFTPAGAELFACLHGYRRRALNCFPRNCFELASDLSVCSVWGLVTLDEQFKKQHARTVRELAEKAHDPFIKGRLLDLVSRYEDDGHRAPTPLTPVDLQFESRGTGSER